MQDLRKTIGVILGDGPTHAAMVGDYKVIVGAFNGAVADVHRKLTRMLSDGGLRRAERDDAGELVGPLGSRLDPQLEDLLAMYHDRVEWHCTLDRFTEGGSHNLPTVIFAVRQGVVVAFFAPIGSPEEKRKQLAKKMN